MNLLLMSMITLPWFMIAAAVPLHLQPQPEVCMVQERGGSLSSGLVPDRSIRCVAVPQVLVAIGPRLIHPIMASGPVVRIEAREGGPSSCGALPGQQL